MDITRDCQASISGTCYWIFQGSQACKDVCIAAPEEDEEEDEWQSPEHEGPCCGSCEWEEAYTDIGMANFGFGCCCKTTIHDKD